MIVITSSWIDGSPETGCNNGKVQSAGFSWKNTKTGYSGTCFLKTCRCGHGCNGSDRLPSGGMSFKSLRDLEDFIADI